MFINDYEPVVGCNKVLSNSRLYLISLPGCEAIKHRRCVTDVSDVNLFKKDYSDLLQLTAN